VRCRRCTQGAPLAEARVVQLGDLGAYAAKPGSRACFKLASEFLRRAARIRLWRHTPPPLDGARTRARTHARTHARRRTRTLPPRAAHRRTRAPLATPSR
jgi:hypothetical protein